MAAIDLILVVALGHVAFDDSWPFMIAAIIVLVALGGTAILARRPKSAERVAVLLGAIRIRRPQLQPQPQPDLRGLTYRSVSACGSG